MLDVNLKLPTINYKVGWSIIILKVWSYLVLSCSEYDLINTIPFILGLFPRDFPFSGP